MNSRYRSGPSCGESLELLPLRVDAACLPLENTTHHTFSFLVSICITIVFLLLVEFLFYTSSHLKFFQATDINLICAMDVNINVFGKRPLNENSR